MWRNIQLYLDSGAVKQSVIGYVLLVHKAVIEFRNYKKVAGRDINLERTIFDLRNPNFGTILEIFRCNTYSIEAKYILVHTSTILG